MSCAVLRVRRGLLKEQRFSDAKEWRYYWCLRFDVAIVFLTIIAMGYEYMDNIDLIHSYSFTHHLSDNYYYHHHRYLLSSILHLKNSLNFTVFVVIF